MSHTATGEWKSFEIRMRRRRAERLVLRADVAAEAGCVEDARALLDEARALWSTAPGLAELQRKIDDVGATPAEAPATAPSRWKEMTAAAAVVLFISAALAVVGAAAIHRRLPARDAKALVDVIPAPSPAPIETLPSIDSSPRTDSQPIETLPAVAAPPPDEATPATRLQEPEREAVPLPMGEPRRASIPAPAETVQLDTPAPMARPPAIATTGDLAPIAPSTAPIQPPQDILVRGALTRYAKAYSDLDVEAAERVWPSVNRLALERAFDSLESQRVTLGDCRVQVDGNTAHASCAGTATWTPKVGGRERTDERSWEFDLEKSAAGWQITSARVQNR